MFLSRRRFTKLSGALGITVPVLLRLPGVALAQSSTPTTSAITAARRPFGRSIANGLVIRDLPSANGKQVRLLTINEVIEIKGQTIGDGPTTYNPIWYQTADGFVHSAYVQPSENQRNAPLDVIDQAGVWVEVSVPIAEVRPQPDANARVANRLYFGMTLRATERIADATNKIWYRVFDGNGGGLGFVLAELLRPLTAKDFEPISPEVPLDKKTIEVNLKEQIATAYENGKPVFSARVATGGSYRTPTGVRYYGTTRGSHRIFMKIPGQRMSGGTPGYDYYNLPGVSWVSYFTGSGIAFHGAYWHNDFGKPRSHGCVNMLPEDAQWVFRWTTPVAPMTANKYVRVTNSSEGSLVKVF